MSIAAKIALRQRPCRTRRQIYQIDLPRPGSLGSGDADQKTAPPRRIMPDKNDQQEPEAFPYPAAGMHLISWNYLVSPHDSFLGTGCFQDCRRLFPALIPRTAPGCQNGLAKSGCRSGRVCCNRGSRLFTSIPSRLKTIANRMRTQRQRSPWGHRKQPVFRSQ